MPHFLRFSVQNTMTVPLLTYNLYRSNTSRIHLYIHDTRYTVLPVHSISEVQCTMVPMGMVQLYPQTCAAVPCRPIPPLERRSWR